MDVASTFSVLNGGPLLKGHDKTLVKALLDVEEQNNPLCYHITTKKAFLKVRVKTAVLLNRINT